jgi:cytoskeletal protein CcmA (bactofilin family)
MSRALVLCVVAWMIVAASSVPAGAIEMRAGPTSRVAQDQNIDDDLYSAGSWVAIEGRVRGDLVGAGGHVGVQGQIDGGVLAAGGTIDIAGPVGASVRALGGTVVIRGPVATDVVAAGGSLVIEPSARVVRDVALAGGSVLMMGTVGRNGWVAGGRVEIGGTVNGNLLIRASELRILPTAVVRGTLTYSAERPIEVAEGARVVGGIRQEAYPVRPMPSRAAARGFRIVFGIVDFFWMLVVALVLVALAPVTVQVAADELRSRPLASLGWGALLLIVVPLVVVALMIMIIGIPVGVLLLVAHVMALFVSHASIGLAVGQFAAPRLRSPYAEVAIGIGLVAIATNLPYIGWVLRLLAVAAGFGALALALWRRRSPAAPHPLPAGPAVA